MGLRRSRYVLTGGGVVTRLTADWPTNPGSADNAAARLDARRLSCQYSFSPGNGYVAHRERVWAAIS